MNKKSVISLVFVIFIWIILALFHLFSFLYSYSPVNNMTFQFFVVFLPIIASVLALLIKNKIVKYSFLLLSLGTVYYYSFPYIVLWMK